MLLGQTNLYIHTKQILQSSVNHIWNTVYSCNRYVEFWMYFGLAFYWISYISWRKLKLASFIIHVSSRISSKIDVIISRKT